MRLAATARSPQLGRDCLVGMTVTDASPCPRHRSGLNGADLMAMLSSRRSCSRHVIPTDLQQSAYTSALHLNPMHPVRMLEGHFCASVGSTLATLHSQVPAPDA